MKRTFTLLTAILISSFIWAQSPMKMSYQAVVRDGSGNLIVNQNIGLKISILQGSMNGILVYEEVLNPATNQNGLLSTEFGGGTGFDTVNFQTGPFFLKTEIDPAGGSNYTISNTSQILSVPFALHANTATNFTGTLNETDPVYAGSVAATISTADITNWNNKLSSYAETDPLFSTSLASGITGTDTANWNSKLSSFTETDPLYSSSTAAGITATDVTNWNNKLSSFTELDPVYSVSVASGITTSDTANWNSKLDFEMDGDVTNEIQSLSVSGSDLTISGGNTVSLPGSPWTDFGTAIAYNNGLVGINTSFIDARLRVEEHNQSDTTRAINAYNDGGIAISGHATSRSSASWNNVGINGSVETTYFPGRGVSGQAYGTNDGEAIRGDATTDGSNAAVVGYALSKTGNTSLQIGGDFVARGDWNTSNGMGTGDHYGVSGNSYGISPWSIGVAGWALNSDTSGNSYGGYFRGYPLVNTSAFSTGAYGKAEGSTNSNVGIFGTTSGAGEFNRGGMFTASGAGKTNDATRNVGVEAWGRGNRLRNYGVYALAYNYNNSGNDTAMVVGVYADANGNNYWNYGVFGTANSDPGGSGNVTAVYGEVNPSAISHPFSQGVDGTAGSRSKENIGVGGWAWGNTSGDSLNYGVYGYAAAADTNFGMYATATGGALGYPSNVNYGIYAEAANGSVANYAGFFEGDVTITGDLNVSGSIAKAAGTFKIDHPVDPKNKYLVHSFMESPDMMNYYSGNITTNANGYATVELPQYFEAANKDYRYQLTTIGSFARAIVKEEIDNNRFVIQTEEPNVKVSWQVTAIRNDAYAQKNRIQPVINKTESEKGKYLHPDLFDMGKDQRIHQRVQGVSKEIVQAKKRASEKIHSSNKKTKSEEMPAPANHIKKEFR